MPRMSATAWILTIGWCLIATCGESAAPLSRMDVAARVGALKLREVGGMGNLCVPSLLRPRGGGGRGGGCFGLVGSMGLCKRTGSCTHCHILEAAERLWGHVVAGAGGDSTAAGKWERRILVTGGCGFAGSVLVDLLSRVHPSYLVVVIDRMDECASIRNIAAPLARDNCVLVRGDVKALPPSCMWLASSGFTHGYLIPRAQICDAALVRRTLRKHSIDTIMHRDLPFPFSQHAR